ncbi:hypothetical protein Slala02_56820 [Streptomyces lavendulae subsp. lavendulae]|nr:hypothetical protein Slala01_57980 [Streptomyces lavendulae subsp. lavendulae]GLX29862.1 hypothetical protein Slala02_56820 [Streptomyces lavendulae subsp. lavendulae]
MAGAARASVPARVSAVVRAFAAVCVVPVGCAVLAGCAAGAPAPGPGPGPGPDPDELIRAATQRLTDACLTRQGLVPPRAGPGRPRDAGDRRVSAALFGAGPAELSLALPTGHVVRAHTDGCLAAAQQRLYGDQPGWFRASVVVNNLRPEADHTHRDLAEVRARHRAEIADWERLRARAVTEATTVLTSPPPKGNPPA